MAKEYVAQRNGGYYIEATRVSLDSVVYAFLRGESPEGIAESFPALTLEQIYGALTFYLANKEAVDRYLAEGKQEFELLRKQAQQKHTGLYSRLRETRQRTRSPHS
ncbi:MAG: DUF433 domain-containing protein [Bryobacteraceae bacterium]